MELENQILADLQNTFKITNLAERNNAYQKIIDLCEQASQQGSGLASYLLAAFAVKDLVSSKPDYKKAGLYISKLANDFSDEKMPIEMHAEDLCQISEHSLDATKAILANSHLRKRIVPEYLARIACSSEDTARYFLTDADILSHLDAFDIGRIAASSDNIAKMILQDDNLCAMLDGWGFYIICDTYEDLCEEICNNQDYMEKFDAQNLISLGKKYKNIAKKIIAEKSLYSKLEMDELKGLRTAHS